MYTAKIEETKKKILNVENEIKRTTNEYNFELRNFENENKDYESQRALAKTYRKFIKVLKILRDVGYLLGGASLAVAVALFVSGNPLGVIPVALGATTAYSAYKMNKSANNKKASVDLLEDILDKIQEMQDEYIDVSQQRLTTLNLQKGALEVKLKDLEEAQERMSRISQKYNFSSIKKDDEQTK